MQRKRYSSKEWTSFLQLELAENYLICEFLRNMLLDANISANEFRGVCMPACKRFLSTLPLPKQQRAITNYKVLWRT